MLYQQLRHGECKRENRCYGKKNLKLKFGVNCKETIYNIRLRYTISIQRFKNRRYNLIVTMAGEHAYNNVILMLRYGVKSIPCSIVILV